MTASLGFLSVRRHPEHGYFGGYLITNHVARPLEFHCTMPVRPSRAQMLLYGPTIDAFVCGEQIAKALVGKAKVKPTVVLTDCPAVLALSSVCTANSAHLQFEPGGETSNFHIPQGSPGELLSLRIEPWHLSILAAQPELETPLTACLSQLGSNFDLTEPFQRVVDALLEAHPIAKAA
ncbi:MAG: hypothetical protein KDA51_01620 [Planctomycetales bacterium]|nr:hypothetical protein [Planctomycetales bacterium]MCA9180110.1 hypothetical protein [Planctomycetales bacterium]